jgi:hypothetical protein
LGTPAPDHHSECAHAIAFTRYAGFPVNSRTLDLSLAHYGARVSELEGKLGEEVLKSHQKRLAMLQALDPLVAASNKRVLSVLADSDRPSASLARDMLDYGPYRQRLLQLQKVKESRTGRAHPDFRVMGTSTARMSGTAGLNWQGIGAAESVEIEEWVDNEREDREFESPEETGEIESEIARDDEKEEGGRRETVGLRAAIETPCVGDFASFEVTIAASVFKDRQLQEDLDHGRDLHAMAVAQAHPEARKRKLTYDQVLAGYRAHDPTITRWRKGMKAVVFGIFYGASAQKVADVLNVSVQEGEEVLEAFYERYEGIGRYKAETERAFVTADTSRWSVESIGSMESAREDLVGFRRSWHFERDCAVTLWGLGSRGVRTGCHGTVVRQQEKGAQSIDQAVRSGLLGSAIAIQAAVCRQAGNMPIQATGANLTKFLMADCWRILRCPLMNVHDELVFGSDRFHARTLSGIVEAFEARYRPLVPPLKFDYKPTRVWADK